MVSVLPLNFAVDFAPDEQILIEEAFMRIGKEYKVFFNYDRAIVAGIKVHYESGSYKNVDEVLKAVFSQTSLQYQIFENRYIAVFKSDKEGIESLKKMILHFQEIVARQEVQNGLFRKPIAQLESLSLNRLYKKKLELNIAGTVTNEEGEALIGVNILVKGTEKGTSSDIDGKFELKNINEKAVLVVSYIGYKKTEVAVNGRSIINIILQSDAALVDEVVVVAFGKQKKEDVIGAVTSINPGELKVPSSNLTTALAGRVAGLIAYQRSGEPGADNAEFFIRGVTTFGYKKDPLILIDGIESTTTDLARLQTDNVENFSILKDATATALYGSRAANGVILIQTKEGKIGAAKISLRIENSVSMPTQSIQLADPITYMKLNNEAVKTRDPLGILTYSNEKIDNTEAGSNPYIYPETDWKKALLKDYTMNQQANLSVSGGGEIARYFVAGSINRDNGILKVDQQNDFNSNIQLNSYTLRSNVNVNITKSTELAIKLSGTFDDYTGPLNGGAGVYNDIMNTPPSLFPPYYPKDSTNKYVQHILFGNYDDGSGSYYINPYAEMVRGYKNYSRSTINSQMRIGQDLSFLADGLNVEVLFNVERYAFFSVLRRYNPFWYQANAYEPRTNTYNLQLLNEEQGTEYLNYEPGDKIVRSGFYTQTTLNYDRSFNEKHVLNGLLVFLAQNRLTGNPTDLQSSLPQRNAGFAGRFSYAYQQRYYAEFDFGYNASERFYKKYRWGFFPSVGIAWNISNEKLWNPIKSSVTNLKLRGTYGLTGNDDIGSPNDRFLYLSRVNMNDPLFGATFGINNNYSRSGVSLSHYPNPSITWEKATKMNLGFDLELFTRWNITADFYKEIRSNILMDRKSLAPWMGLWATPKANIGKAEGKGVDISLDYNQAFSNGFWIQGRANFTYAASKFLVYEENNYKDVPWKSYIGFSIGQRWGHIAERLFVDDIEARKSPYQNFGEYGGGDIKYHDINKDGQITTLDQVPLGYPVTPEIVYGFGFSIGYKQFDFSAFFQGLARESFFINPGAIAPFVRPDSRREHALLKDIADNHWSEDNRELYPFWPRLSVTPDLGNNNNFERSTWWMRNGAFLRVKQVEIGYTLSQEAAHKIYMKNLRIYINSTNPLIWSVFKQWDVEQGDKVLNYPIQKVFNVGVLLSF